ncbi:hypothetical protein [Hyalangium versicolor]|uniref:hypothetical protein n=1 Tax=Hyalangium versicolor TaxID=2861190 RepID=UPI001CCDDA7E|nr:hypothetical protein [Hyalangium versicolor]
MAKGRTPKQRRSASGSKRKSDPSPSKRTPSVKTTGRRRPVPPRKASEAPPPERALAPLRRDTPKDLPAVVAPEKGSGGTHSVLARLRSLENLETAYEAWLELKLEHGSARLRFQEERERLDQQGAFLVGAVRAAGVEPTPGSQPGIMPTGADSFLRGAEARLSQAREELARKEADSEAFYQQAFAEIRSTLTDRIRRYLEGSRPSLQLLLRKVGATRSILHISRVGQDESLLLCFLFTGRIPSRYGFLFDDSTDDVSLPPAPLYPDEGVEPRDTRPTAAALEARIRAPGEVLPLKGFLPIFMPRPAGGEDFFRLLQRGPVMEVEVADGAEFRNILSREEAERFAGHLLRLKLEGKLELEIEAG